MFVISNFLFIAFFIFLSNLFNKTQLNNSMGVIEISFNGATFAFPHKSTKVLFLVITQI